MNYNFKERTNRYTISDIDECSNDPCDEPSNCVNTPGSFECICYGQLMEPFCGAGMVNQLLFMCLFRLPFHRRIYVEGSITEVNYIVFFSSL